MKAEELYGVQGYQYLGNGEFVAVAGGPPQANHRGEYLAQQSSSMSETLDSQAPQHHLY